MGGDNRALIVQGGSNVVLRKNLISGAYGGGVSTAGVQINNVTYGTVQDNFIVGVFPGDALSMLQCSYTRSVGNYIEVSIGDWSGAGFTVGDIDPNNRQDPGHDNYIAGNYVKQSGGVPAGVFGSTGNTVLEHNLLTGGVQAYNYAGDPNDSGASPELFVDVTLRYNAIGPGSYTRPSSELIEYDNVFGTAVTPADVPGGLGYFETDGTWVWSAYP